MSEIDRLREENKFLKSLFKSCCLQMDGQHSWRARGGWPANRMRGPNIDEAVRNGIKAYNEEKL